MAPVSSHSWRRAAIAAVLATAPLFPGCRCRPAPGEEEYREGLRSFLAQEYGSAEPHLRAALEEDPSGGRVGELHYLLGAIALRRGATPEARRHFEACLRSPTNDQLSAGAALGLARCYSQSGEYRQCREACLDILRSHPQTPRADEACFLLGEASDHAGLRSEAREYYRKVVSMASSRWAKEAAARLAGKAAAPPLEVVPAQAAPSARLFVQVAALKLPAQAAEQAKRLRDKGYPAAVARTHAGSEELHAVQVGPFATRDEADRVAARLKQDGFPSVMIKP